MSLETGRLPRRGSRWKGHLTPATNRRAKHGANRARRIADKRAERGEDHDPRGVPTSGWAW